MDTGKNRFVSPALAAALAGLLALAVAMGIGRFAFTPILPMMLQDAGLTLAGGGLLASANYVGYLLGAVAATLVRLPHARTIRGGLLVIGVTTVAMGADLPLAGWIVMRLIAGVASALALIAVSAWSLEVLARYRRPLLNSVVFAGVGTGIAMAGLLCIALTQAHAGSADVWIALGLFALLMTAAVWRFFSAGQESAGQAASGARSGYRWNAESINLILCYGAYGFGYIIPATFLPVMAKRALQDPTLFGWSWPIFGAAALVSTLAASLFIRRFGSRRVWVGSHFLMATGVALPAVWPHIAAIFLAALLVGGTFIVVTVCAVQEAKRIAADAAASLIGAMTSAFAVGQIAGPLCVAYVFKGSNGFSEALLISAFLLAASGFALTRDVPIIERRGEI